MTFDEIWERIRKETGIRNQNQMAKALGVSQPAISQQKKKDEFPADWAFKIAQTYSLNTDWIMTGEGEARKGKECTKEKEIFKGELRDWLEEKTKEDPEFFWKFSTRCAGNFDDFREWLKKKESPMVSGNNQGQGTK